MEIALHNRQRLPELEHIGPNQVRVHVGVGAQLEDVLSAGLGLSDDQLASLSSLWADTSVSRKFQDFGDFVLVTFA